MIARRLAVAAAAALLIPVAAAEADGGPLTFDVAVAGSQTVTGTYSYQPPACWSFQGSSHQTTAFHTDATSRLVLQRGPDGSLTGTTRVVLKASTERQGGLDIRQPPGCVFGLPPAPPGDCGTRVGDFDAQLAVKAGRLRLQGAPAGTFESCPLWQPTSGAAILLDADGGLNDAALDAGGTVTATAAGDLPQHAVSSVQGSSTIDTDTRSSSTVTLTPVVHHYEVQLQGWIAQPHVVDPLTPVPLPYLAVALTGGCMYITNFDSFVASTFHGDGHAGYDGTHRGLEVAQFDWDGSRITNFAEHGDFGVTSRDMVYHGPLGESWPCSQTGRATKAASAAPVGDSDFQLKLSAANPLIPLDLAPTADQELAGHIDPDGTLRLHYDADLFPSAGLRVLRDGQELGTYVINDTSCVPEPDMLGPLGLGLLTRGLVSHDVHGSVTVAPADAHALRVDRSPLCATPAPVALDVISNGGAGAIRIGTPAANGSAAAAARAHSMTLAAAQRQGLLTATARGGHVLISMPADTRLSVVADRRGAVAAISTTARTTVYGPAHTNLVVTADRTGPTVRDGSRRLAPHPADRTPPRTHARVTRHGHIATIHLTATDRSGVATTVAALGSHPVRLRRDSLRIPATSLRRARFFSIDVFGNREAPRRVAGR
ncbi:hypothetical protein [Candidatus Solirubrobacter pratensis]|uniref:hypothetical protein n=1 Tax=Candidatus Solirubrobacter pratensis TaxID=1298857 RepID=UPI0003FA6561|nr:hypothetical protein [Candidatus Solirubrobacter pratensis]